MQNYNSRNYPAGGPVTGNNVRSPMSTTTMSSARRGPGPMLPTNPNQVSTAQLHAQQQAEMLAQTKKLEDARNRSRRPADRNLPDGLAEIVIGDGVQRYNTLRDVERELDAVMMRKRLDIQDSIQRGPKQYGTMRIWVSNTCENQPWQASGMDAQAFDFSSNVEANFKVKIEGRMLETDLDENDTASKDDVDAAMTSSSEEQTTNEDGERAAKRTKLSAPLLKPRKKFSHFFKSITVKFNRPQSFQPDGYTEIKWVRPEFQSSSHAEPPREADFDCLEFSRKADENINITIDLVPDEQPERYKLAAPLAELLDMEEADRQTVIMGIWEYVKSAGLQGDEEHRRIACDDRLRDIFQTDNILVTHLPDLIRPFLSDLPPLTLPYTIRVDKPFHTSTPAAPPTIYDISLPVPSPLLTRLRTITLAPTHTSTLQAISALDQRLATLVQAMAHSKAKHAFLTNMSADPAGFVKRWIGSQKRDMEVVKGKGPWGWGEEMEWKDEEWRRGGGTGVWGSREAWEGVGSFLSRPKA